jgi:hypothetical protein
METKTRLGIVDQPFKHLSQESPMQISILIVSSHVEPQNYIDSYHFYVHTLFLVLGFKEKWMPNKCWNKYQGQNNDIYLSLVV